MKHSAHLKNDHHNKSGYLKQWQQHSKKKKATHGHREETGGC